MGSCSLVNCLITPRIHKPDFSLPLPPGLSGFGRGDDDPDVDWFPPTPPPELIRMEAWEYTEDTEEQGIVSVYDEVGHLARYINSLRSEIRNLESTVKAYAAMEPKIITSVVQAAPSPIKPVARRVAIRK